MGFLDKIKKTASQVEKAVGEHPDQLKSALSKVEGIVDKKTGGKHHGQISKFADKAEDYIEKEAKQADQSKP
ncbi:MAG: antitoxin [Frankiaceae bacterium]|nr:antitoxin [Frankiaceae bacterium]MBV9872839.1 antitoxin [Frankiaceae bacterium]